MNRVSLLALFLVFIIAGSCVSRRKLTYLQYSDQSAEHGMEQKLRTSVTPAIYKVMPNDYLFIRVITPDPQWSALFNTQTGEGGVTQESASLSSYPVDIYGDIEIPYVGKVRVSGKTLSEIKTDLDYVFKNYVTDAAITVRLVENNLTIIGEVNAPGRYPIIKENLTIFDAIAMAGDLSVI